MGKYCVYIHKNKINGKIYVGQTCLEPRKRWKNGKGYSEKNQSKMYYAIQKYGWDNFEHIIIAQNLTLDEANELEQKLIIEYDSFKNGYNMSLGGDGNPGHTVPNVLKEQMKNTHRVPHLAAQGRSFSDEHKQRLSQAKQGKKRGPRSSETKEKISQALKGKSKTAEAKLNMSKAKKGIKPWNAGLVGIKGHAHSEDTKNAIALKNGHAIRAYDPITLELKLTFISIMKAIGYLRENTEFKNANRNTLVKFINKNKICYSFIWKLEKENL